MKYSISLAVALVLHLTLGWMWSIGGAIVLGAWSGKRGWLSGASLLSLSWSLLVGYNFVIAASSTQRMIDVMGGILGNLPSLVVLLATILIGAILGLIGGGLGGALVTLVRQDET